MCLKKKNWGTYTLHMLDILCFALGPQSSAWSQTHDHCVASLICTSLRVANSLHCQWASAWWSEHHSSNASRLASFPGPLLCHPDYLFSMISRHSLTLSVRHVQSCFSISPSEKALLSKRIGSWSMPIITTIMETWLSFLHMVIS